MTSNRQQKELDELHTQMQDQLHKNDSLRRDAQFLQQQLDELKNREKTWQADAGSASLQFVCALLMTRSRAAAN